MSQRVCSNGMGTFSTRICVLPEEVPLEDLYRHDDGTSTPFWSRRAPFRAMHRDKQFGFTKMAAVGMRSTSPGPCVGSIETASAHCTCKTLATAPTLSPPLQEGLLKTHCCASRSQHRGLENLQGRRINRAGSPEAREITCKNLVDAHDVNSFSLEDTNQHVKTIMRGLITEPQPSGAESGEIK